MKPNIVIFSLAFCGIAGIVFPERIGRPSPYPSADWRLKCLWCVLVPVIFLLMAGNTRSQNARTAPALSGPWSEQRAIYEFPEMSEKNPRRDADTWCYAVKEHIEFAQADKLLITYACNSFKSEKLIANTDIYRPQVVLVNLSTPAQ